MLSATDKHVFEITELSEQAVKKLEDHYFVNVEDFKPRVFYRITDNWLELTARFIVSEHHVREVKDAISRDLLRGLDKAGIGVASTTFDIVGFPPLRLENDLNKSMDRE